MRDPSLPTAPTEQHSGHAAVIVDEAQVLDVLVGGTWWTLYRAQHEPTGRIRVLTVHARGDRVCVACDTAADAEALAAMFTGRGLPETAVSVAA